MVGKRNANIEPKIGNGR